VQEKKHRLRKTPEDLKFTNRPISGMKTVYDYLKKGMKPRQWRII
jgi:hypothetical protein